MPVVTEVMETETFDLVEEYADIIQIGTRNMQNFSLLRRAGDNFLESVTSGFEKHRGRMTAADTTGPANGPRPASSSPAIVTWPPAAALFS